MSAFKRLPLGQGSQGGADGCDFSSLPAIPQALGKPALERAAAFPELMFCWLEEAAAGKEKCKSHTSVYL